MDTGTQQRLDHILEDEVKRGYRVKAVPASVNEQLEGEGGPAISRVRLTRLNPARRRKIAEVVQRQYHRDLQNPEILSREQVMKLVRERGEWTEQLEIEMKELQEKTNAEMGELFLNGIAKDDWTADLLKATSAFRAKLKALVAPEQEDSVERRLRRWIEYTSDQQKAYDEAYASEQGRETYSVDVDYMQLKVAVPDFEAQGYLEQIEDLRDKLQRFIKLQRNRIRLAELQQKQTKIFADTVEQRRDNAEEMARLYFVTERLDEEGRPLGPLVPTFDDLWNWPEDVIQWFLVEVYFFLNGIPDEAREYLQTFGFLKADGEDETIRSPNGESEPSDESPAPPNSKLDSSPATEASNSSDSSPVTTSTTAS